MKMQKPQYVKHFEVHHAQYQLDDGNGTVIRLLVDYKNNSFHFEPASQSDSNFEKEARKIAQGLLQRKHGANLAEREQYI